MAPTPARARYGARAAVAAAVLVACAFGIVDALPEPVDTPDAEAPEASRPVVWEEAEAPTAGDPCDKPNKVVTFLIDGARMEAEIFAPCDPRPYHDLGDPPPSPP